MTAKGMVCGLGTMQLSANQCRVIAKALRGDEVDEESDLADALATTFDLLALILDAQVETVGAGDIEQGPDGCLRVVNGTSPALDG